MVGTKLKKGRASFVISAAAGGGWVIQRTDKFEAPRVVTVAELNGYRIEDGREVTDPPSSTPEAVAEAEARGWASNAPDVAELLDGLSPKPADDEPLTVVGLSACDELRRQRRDGAGNQFYATPEDHFALTGSGSDALHKQAAARRIARDLLADDRLREDLQAGRNSPHPLVVKAAKQLLDGTKGEA